MLLSFRYWISEFRCAWTLRSSASGAPEAWNGTYTPPPQIVVKPPSLKFCDSANGCALPDPSTLDAVKKYEKPALPLTYGRTAPRGVIICRPRPPNTMLLEVVTSTVINPSAPPPSGCRRVTWP